MDSWQGIGPDHFYTTGTTYHRWSSERSRFWGLTNISAHRHFEQGFGASRGNHPSNHPSEGTSSGNIREMPPDGGAAYCSGAGKILILSKSCAEGTANTPLAIAVHCCSKVRRCCCNTCNTL